MKLRKLFFVAGFLLILLGAFVAWRNANPPLDDRERIVAHFETMRQAAEKQDVSGVTRFLSDQFRWQNLSKRDLRSQLAAYFFTNDAVQVQLSDVDVQINGDAATTSGNYRVSTRSSKDSPFESQTGRFSLKWRKTNGDWKIESAEGGENLGH